MSDRDARYRQQAMRAEQRAGEWRSRCLDVLAALVIESGDADWFVMLPVEDRDEARSRMQALRDRMVTRSR